MGPLRTGSCQFEVYEMETPSRTSGLGQGSDLANELSLENLQLLEDAFENHKTSVGGMSQGKPWKPRQREEAGGADSPRMSLEEFRKVLSSVMGPGVSDGASERFFREVDIDSEGLVDWPGLCAFLLRRSTERASSSTPTDAVGDASPLIKHCLHNKQETTVRVVAVLQPSVRFISVSKGGRLIIWNSRLHILQHFYLRGDPADKAVTRGSDRFRGWTTDAVYMTNVHKVAIATGCRDLRFLNYSPAGLSEEVILYGFPNVPTALCYWYDEKSPGRRSLLLWGDDKGGVHLMWFLNPSKGLFESLPANNRTQQRVYMPDLSSHSRLVSYQHIPDVHKAPINRVLFEARAELIITSSESDDPSLVVTHASLRRDPRVWRIDKGVRCFHYSQALRLLATGGFDPVIRLWNEVVPQHPVALLQGHRSTVLDVVFHTPLDQVLSYSRDGELRVWDISSQRCLRTLRLRFPCFQPGRSPEQSNFPFLLLQAPPPGKAPPLLLVACKDYLALLRLAGGSGEREEEGERVEVGRGRGASPVTVAMYNAAQGQVVAGHRNSSVSAWEVATGQSCFTIHGAHGNEALTCMTADDSGRRLITGARNGTLKVWDLLNGQNLLKLEPVSDSAVTGVTCLRGNLLLTVGRTRRLALYDIRGAKDVFVKADMSWKSQGVHRADILAVASCPALGLVATASYDGEVVVWRAETRGPAQRLQRDAGNGVTPPVDHLLFLQRRAADRGWRNQAVLVSSQGGCLYFWSLDGQTQPHGQFFCPERPGDRVSSLSSDRRDNCILVSGDTAGGLQLWDISRYALDVLQEPVCAGVAPLLGRWRAHRGALVCAEVLDLPQGRFLLSASADGSTRLWTSTGVPVGRFGTGGRWDVARPGPYERASRGEENEEEDEEREGGNQRDPAGRIDQVRVKGQTSGHSDDKGQMLPDQFDQREPSLKPVGEVTTAETLNQQEPQQPRLSESLFEDTDLRRSRRSRSLGGLDLNKLFQVGICTPYHALVLQNCEDLPLPAE